MERGEAPQIQGLFWWWDGSAMKCINSREKKVIEQLPGLGQGSAEPEG